jgi:hypothetical protein
MPPPPPPGIDGALPLGSGFSVTTASVVTLVHPPVRRVRLYGVGVLACGCVRNGA